MENHGVNVIERETSISTPATAKSGVPFVIGAAPIQSAVDPAPVGVPVLCTSWNEAVERLGYSENWKDYGLCEFMYSHFKLFGCQPVIFCNLLNASNMKTAFAGSDADVTDHKARLPLEALSNTALTVKPAGGTGDVYVSEQDYSTYYDGEALVIELLPTGACYSAETIHVSYDRITPESVTAMTVAAGMEHIEQCLTTVGIVPDLICAPGHSQEATVAAAMATKAAGINGMFTAKALIDISCADDGAVTYAQATALKSQQNIIDTHQIACWPCVKLGGRLFHLSTQAAGLMAQVDSGNNSCPYESPSNKPLQCDAMVLADGTEVRLTLSQANILNAAGVVTALKFMNGWTLWGNYTACYPASTDVKDYFIPISRMFGWVGNTLIRTFWKNLDKPMNRRLIGTILNTANIWLNGLVGAEYLLGARAEMLEAENPQADLMAGIIRLHLYLTPPAPAQEIDFILEYDAEYVSSALQS